MRKHISFFLATVLLATILCFPSCSFNSTLNGIATYGNAKMYDDSFINDITWLVYEDELYCYVGSLEGNPTLSEGVAGFTQGEYSYEIFLLSDYPGLLGVHSVSRINFVNSYCLYAGKDAVSIPSELMYDFPHTDTWLSGGQVTEMNGTNYCIYYSTCGDFTVGEKLFAYDGRDFYAVPDHDGWVATPNETDATIYDLYYDTDTVTALPVDLLFATNSFVEN